MTVTVYGDSILKGVLYEEGKYRLNTTWEHSLAEELGLTIRNRSRFGSTIGKAMPSLERESMEQGSLEDHVLLEFGGNDCDYDWEAIAREPDARHHCKTPPELFAASYRKAIDLIRGSGRLPIALTLPPIHSGRYLDYICRRGLSRDAILSWLGDVEALGRWQKTYSDLVLQLAREEQAEVIDVRGAFPTEPDALEALLCQDGIHPSRAGQELIYSALRAHALMC